MQIRSFMVRAGLAMMAVVGMASSVIAPSNSSAQRTLWSGSRSSRSASRPGTPLPSSLSEIRQEQMQQARKSAGADRTRLRVLRWNFRAIRGMKARKVGVPLFDRAA